MEKKSNLRIVNAILNDINRLYYEFATGSYPNRFNSIGEVEEHILNEIETALNKGVISTKHYADLIETNQAVYFLYE